MTLLDDHRGAFSLEFAIVGSLFLAISFGVIDIGQYFYASSALREATEATLRNALVDQTIVGCEAAQAKLAGTPVASMKGFSMCVTRKTASGIPTIIVDGALPYRASAYALIVKSQTLKEEEAITVPN